MELIWKVVLVLVLLTTLHAVVDAAALDLSILRRGLSKREESADEPGSLGESASTPSEIIRKQMQNPAETLSVLLLIGGDVVQKAIAQMTGNRVYIKKMPRAASLTLSPMCFSFGWVAYAFGALGSVFGDGFLMPAPEIKSAVMNPRSKNSYENESWVVARLLRDLEHQVDDELRTEMEQTLIDEYRREEAAGFQADRNALLADVDNLLAGNLDASTEKSSRVRQELKALLSKEIFKDVQRFLENGTEQDGELALSKDNSNSKESQMPKGRVPLQMQVQMQTQVRDELEAKVTKLDQLVRSSTHSAESFHELEKLRENRDETIKVTGLKTLAKWIYKFSLTKRVDGNAVPLYNVLHRRIEQRQQQLRAKSPGFSVVVKVLEAEHGAAVPLSDWIWWLSLLLVVVQLFVSSIPWWLNSDWSIFLVTAAGTLLAVSHANLIPQWRHEKYNGRTDSNKTYIITRGNGHKHVFVIKNGGTVWDTIKAKYVGFGMNLEDLAIVKRRTEMRTYVLSVLLTLLWIVLLIVVSGLERHTWYLFASGGIGMANNVFVASWQRTPRAHGVPLKAPSTGESGRYGDGKTSNMKVLLETEAKEPGVGFALLPLFFPGGLQDDEEKAQWSQLEKSYSKRYKAAKESQQGQAGLNVQVGGLTG